MSNEGLSLGSLGGASGACVWGHSGTEMSAAVVTSAVLKTKGNRGCPKLFV